MSFLKGISQRFVKGSLRVRLLLTFGLGGESHIDELRVRWPGGGEQCFQNLPVDCRLTIVENCLGSNPPGNPLIERWDE